MPLESLTHAASLHKLGTESVNALSLSLGNLPLAFRPEEEAQIPSPALFGFENEAAGKQRADEGTADKPDLARENSHNKAADDGKFNRLPTIAECATHLELLEVFYVTRQKILVSKEIDNALNIHPNRETKTGKKGDKKTLKDETFWDRRQEKWKRFLEFACVRFLSWMDGLGPDDTIVTGNEPRLPKHLPPLDILMVWHSALLNPILFYQTCGKRLIWRIRFPWEAIHAAIKSRDWTFELSEEDTAAYRNRTDLHPDLYQSFCEWDPPAISRSYYSWEARGGNREKPPIPLTRFSLQDASYVGRVEEPLNTVNKRAIAKYCEIFPKIDKELAGKLRDAVIRQATFVDKMNAHLWIRSPAVEGTLRRAIDRYTKFLGILARGKKFTIVPTLDVDLAWHTNQCYSGLGYASTMKARVGRFINHDDTIAKETLGDGFETRKLWRIYYGKEYRICGCWDCEALTSAIEKASSEAELETIATRVEMDVRFHRIVELRRRKKEPLPKAQDT
jgi:hypothetical protein